MSELEQIKHNLVNHKQELAEKFHVSRLGIFGSYVRSENTKDSDLDVLVEFSNTPGLFTFIRLKNYLSEIVGIKVDLVMKRALKTHIGQNIMDEVIYL